MSDGGRGWSVGLPCGELKQTMSKVRLFNFDNELTGRVCCGGVFEERAQKKEDGIDRLDCFADVRNWIFRLSKVR